MISEMHYIPLYLSTIFLRFVRIIRLLDFGSHLQTLTVMNKLLLPLCFLCMPISATAQVYTNSGVHSTAAKVWMTFFIALLFIIIGWYAHFFYAKWKLRKALDERIKFYINTAHHIRTPLTLIKAPLEEVADKESLSDSGLRNVNTALRNVESLLRLSTNFINLERINNSPASLYTSEYELGTYLQEIINSFRSYAVMKRINLIYESNFRYLNIRIDKEKMDAILKNIISNALKYTPEGGQVHILSTEAGNFWSIEVKDNGHGIPAAEQKKVFKSYFRGTNVIKVQATGSGIGLLLVWKLVRLHKGKIVFNSTENKGTRFKLTFPKNDVTYKEIENTSPQRKDQILQFELTSQEKNVLLEEKKSTITQLKSNAPKLLIAEANDELREYLQRTLSDNYSVKICSNGKEALALIEDYLPDLVISDMEMPEMQGNELCNILKNNIETSHIPIIMITSLDNDQSIMESLSMGADEYIVKPFNISILRMTISNILINRALLRQKYGNLELNDDQQGPDCINCSNDIEWNFIANVKKSVEEHIDNPEFNVDVLCGLLNMSRTSLYNKIKALTDQAPADYIRLIRLKQAATLLEEQQYSVTEVAEKTGFSDAKYFREVFKKYFKMSPSQYAKKMASNQKVK